MHLHRQRHHEELGNVHEITLTTEHLIEQASLSELRSKNRSHRATMLTIFLAQLAQIYLFTERSVVKVISCTFLDVSIKLKFAVLLVPISCLSATFIYAADPQDAIALSQFQQSVSQMQSNQSTNTATANNPQRIVLNPVPTGPAVVASSDSQSAQIAALSGSVTAPQLPDPTITVQQPTVQQLMQEQPNYDQKQAYGAMLQQAMPMTPSQIIDLKRRMAAAQRAAAAAPESPPQPVTSSRIVNLAPGATPPVIRLEQGFITTLDFVDVAGSPWPVSFMDNGNPSAFNISWDKKGNTLMIQALKPYTYGNLAVSLQGLNTPIMLTLIPGQQMVDYRVDLRVSGLAPGSLSQYANMNSLPDSANQDLLQVLNGIGSENSTELQVDGDSAQAWEKGNKLFIRSKFAILSPGWTGHMRSPDGTNAYEIQKTPMILISQFGTPVEVKINGV